MRRVRYLRFAVALAAVLAVFASMQHHGVAVGSICMLCPVGFLSPYGGKRLCRLGAYAGGSWRALPSCCLSAGRSAPLALPDRRVEEPVRRTQPARRGGAGRTCARAMRAFVLGRLVEGPGRRADRAAGGFVRRAFPPVFCLVCPIRLALGTVYAVSRAFVL